MPDAYSTTRSIQPLKTRWKITVIGAAIAALAIGFTWQMREAILTHVAAWWVVSDELTHADAIAVLGGSIDVRPFAAADLYKRGLASNNSGCECTNEPSGRTRDNLAHRAKPGGFAKARYSRDGNCRLWRQCFKHA